MTGSLNSQVMNVKKEQSNEKTRSHAAGDDLGDRSRSSAEDKKVN